MYAVIDRNTPAGTSLSPELYPEGWVMVLDKPYRWTSADAVRKIKFTLKKLYHQNNIKVGHAGTLDPLATGVLLICAGKATKVSEALQAERKEYIAEVTFGATTPSFDMEHEVDARYPWEHITEEAIAVALKSMEGEQMQLPPVYSAKYVDGIRAYEMARQGEEVALKGAFARDLGVALGSGAYLSGLVRTASGGFSIGNALTMEDFQERF